MSLSRLLDQSSDRVSRLRAFADPILHAIGFQIDLRRLARRIVGPEIFEIGTVAFRLLFFDYDAI